MSGRSRRGLLGLLAGGAVFLVCGRWISGLYADFAFFDALGQAPVWRDKARTTSVVALSAFTIAWGFAFANLYAVRQSIVSLVLPRQIGDLEVTEAIPVGRLTLAAALLATAMGLLFALLPIDWSRATLALGGVSFQEIEPYLERDIGFYVGWLPFERSVQERCSAAVVVVTALVIVCYTMTPSLRWGRSGLSVSTWVRRHLAVLMGLLVIMVAWDWRLDRYERISQPIGSLSSAGLDQVFSVFDHRVGMPYLGFVSVLALAIAAVLVWAGWKGSLRLVLAMLSLLVLAGPVAGSILPILASRDGANAERRLRERPYANTAGHFTRRAFGADDIVRADRTSPRVVSTPLRSRAISVWEPPALASHIGRDPQAAGDAATAWRGSAAGLVAVVLRQSGTGPSDTRWRAHAFLASQSDQSGRPVPAASSSWRLRDVLVYPGASTSTIVADSLARVAAPPFAGGMHRVALAWALQEPRVVFTDPPQPRPKLLVTRDVRSRIQRLVPFLSVGQIVSPVLAGDALYWFVELFSVSSAYPLSTPVTADGRAVRYARHAGTAVVSAQTGGIALLPADAPDAVTRFWMERFPTLFESLTGPSDWMRLARPPAYDQLRIQGAAVGRVGSPGDTSRERRVVAHHDSDPEVRDVAPMPFLLDTTGVLGWALSVDAPAAGRGVGLLVALGGVDRRTEFHAATAPRWTTVRDSIPTGTVTRGLGGAGEQIVRGRIQGVPTTRGPLWVQGHFAWPSDGSPRLSGVVTSSIDGIGRGRTLGEALGEPPMPLRRSPNGFRSQLRALYRELERSLRTGDWPAFGTAWEELGRVLDRP